MRGLWPDDVSLVGNTGIYLLDLFCSLFQLCHFLCVISFLYLDLYVLGDDTSTSPCKPNIYVALSTPEIRVRLVPSSINFVTDRSKAVL